MWQPQCLHIFVVALGQVCLSLTCNFYALQGLQSASWEDALAAAKEALLKHKGNELRFIAGKLADAESLIALKACHPLPQSLI